MGDPERLQQVFWNLFSNAIKFTPKNGRVRVSVESVGSNVEVVVADTGSGIDAEFLPRVFDRFTQNDSVEHAARSRPRPGPVHRAPAGRAPRRQHPGARARASATAPRSRRGSRVPRSRPAPLDPRVYSQADRAVGLDEGPDLTGIRVLVVEDDDDARGLVEKVLETRAPP